MIEFLCINIMQIKDLEEDVRSQQDEHSNLLREISEGKYSSTSSRGGISVSA